MREIKFRGKTQNGKWVYGYFAKFAHDSVPAILEDTEDGIEPRKIIPGTVFQFTGLHDRNGKEIYEGDIVSFTADKESKNWVRPIKWLGAGFTIEMYSEHYICEHINLKLLTCDTIIEDIRIDILNGTFNKEYLEK
uniref:YopX family protein n=1 Tax=Alistipes sp. TaxID=1872444 RepID=UPI0040561EF4